MDAEHIVLLMQENRSFDHTFGTLQGVRGFNDPRAIRLANDNPVWLQTNEKGETYAPFHLDIKDTKVTWMGSLPHSWSNQVDARNNGRYDQWLQAKKPGNNDYADMPLTMGVIRGTIFHFITPLPMHLPFVISISVLRLRAQHQTVCISGAAP